MQADFAGRHVVVTGGSGALGQGVVLALLEAGAVCHVPVRGAESLSRFPLARHGNVRVSVDVDPADGASTRAFFESLPDLWASIHCAGSFALSPIEATTDEALRRMFAANVETCFLSCREAVRRMRRDAASSNGRAGRGRIVNVAARPALEARAGAGMVAYAASKAAVAALTVALAEELAADGIWVNAVAPSILDTEANRDAMPDADPDSWVRVEEAAATIAFLASPRNTSTRGAVVPIYGRS